MDIRVAITNDLLAQANKCFNDKKLTFAYLEHIAKNTANKFEMLKELELIHKRIIKLEEDAKKALQEAIAIEKEALSEQWYSYKRDEPFAPSEFYDFFSDERNFTELCMYYQKESPVTRIENSIKQLEGLRLKKAKKALYNLIEVYPKKILKGFKMLRKFLNASYILILLSSFAHALDIPKSSNLDPRITFAMYEAKNVVLIRCKVGYVSMVEFEKDERILNIATGFLAGWEISDKDNYLFIKPKAYAINTAEQDMTDENGDKIKFQGSTIIQPNENDWKTNLLVTTNKNRVYHFDLVLANNKNNVNYRVEFAYTTQKDELEIKQKIAKQKAELKKELERVNIPRNWNFVMHVNKDSQSITPDFAYDDGVFTYLGFSTTKTIPSAFLFDKKNKESILNTHIKKDGKYDVLVIHKTAKQILLRSGDKLVGIFNKGYGQNPKDETNNTNKANIIREIIVGE